MKLQEKLIAAYILSIHLMAFVLIILSAKA